MIVAMAWTRIINFYAKIKKLRLFKNKKSKNKVFLGGFSSKKIIKIKILT